MQPLLKKRFISVGSWRRHVGCSVNDCKDSERLRV